MSAKPIQDRADAARENRDLRERDRAIAFVREYPIPDKDRNILLRVLVDHINGERRCFVGTRRLAFEARISRPTVRKFMNEFAEKGLIEFLGDAANGMKREVRVNYERTSELYGYATIEAGNTGVSRSDETEAGKPEFPGLNGYDRTKRETENAKAGNENAESGKPMRSPEVNQKVNQKNATLDARASEAQAQLPLAGGASHVAAQPATVAAMLQAKHNPPGGGTARVFQRAATASTSQPTIAVPTRASNEHVQQPRVSQRTTTEATVDDLVAQFRKLCDKGLCSWTSNKMQHSTMLTRFGQLIRERVVTADTMRKALPIAEKRVGKKGRPSGAAIVAAMFEITKARPAEPTPVEDNAAFFDRPAAEAGTFNAPGNFTLH